MRVVYVLRLTREPLARGRQGKKKMALAERFLLATRPSFPKARMLEVGRLAFVATALAVVAAIVLPIFALGHPITALWLAAAFCAWAFIFGAARASETPSRPRRRNGS